MLKKLIFSGIQPTGSLHLGNYLGAVRNWIELSNSERTFFCIVDLHAITNCINHSHDHLSFQCLLKQQTFDMACSLMAFDLHHKSCLYVQSHLHQHLQLNWILSCLTPFNWLSTMTQFKEKSKDKEKILGLFSYPILMASDILLHKATHVPIGQDQTQHLQLAKKVIQRTNKLLFLDFPLPQPIFSPFRRVMSLQDGSKKMSKSGRPQTCINVFDDPQSIRKRIKVAKTDSFHGLIASPQRPQVSNLLSIYQQLKGPANSPSLDMTKQQFKELLAETIIEHFKEPRKKYEQLRQRRDLVEEQLRKGKARAQESASQTLKQIKEKVGFLSI